MRAIPAPTCFTWWLRHAGNSFPTALGEEYRKLAFGMFPAADRARYGRVRLIHRADRFEDIFAIMADIFVNWHNYLSGFSNDLSRYHIILPFISG